MGTDDRFSDLKYAMNTRLFLLMAGVVLIFNAVTSTATQSMNWISIAKIVSEYDGEVPPEEPAAASAAETALSVDEAVLSAAEAPEAVLSAAEGTASLAEEPASADSGAAAAEAPADTGSGDASGTQELDVPALIRSMNSLGITVDDLRLVGYAGLVMVVIRVIVGFLCVLFSNRVNRANITFTAAIILAVCEAVYAILLLSKSALSIGALLYTVIITGILLVGAIRMRKIAKHDPGRVLALQPSRSARRPEPEAPKKSIHDRVMMNAGDDEETEKRDE